MDKKELIRKFAAGLFLLIGIGLIFVFIFTIGKDKGFVQQKFKVVVLFRNVGGLIEGAPIRLSGVNVGTVGNIDFLEGNIQGRRVKVTLNIYEKYKKQLDKIARFAVQTEGILGEKLVEITVAENGGKLNLNEPIIGEDPLDVQGLAEVFAGAAESFTKTSQELSQIDIVELSQVMKESSAALLETANGVNAIMKDLKVVTQKSKRLLDRIEQRIIEGNLFKVF
ncbi:MAG: hypothetical protein A2Z81_05175 [Omnitrophica WOR_2 bacterium GWA2_45_18]|nr:MAG: hypothetical protein A2Z81_05175 [Omnitrophica WOR_2 bacterium GWA2_45_18]